MAYIVPIILGRYIFEVGLSTCWNDKSNCFRCVFCVRIIFIWVNVLLYFCWLLWMVRSGIKWQRYGV